MIDNFLVSILSLIGLLVGIEQDVGKKNTANSDHDVIAVVGDRPIMQAEMIREMRNLRWRVMGPVRDGETAQEYWLAERGDSARMARLYNRAMHVLHVRKVLEQILVEYNLWQYADFEHFKLHLVEANRARIVKKKKGQLIYGPEQYSEQTFLEYQTAIALIKLKELLVADGTLPITEQALAEQYAEMKRGPYQRDKFTFSAYRRQITAAYIEKAFDHWLSAQVTTIAVERLNEPDFQTLYHWLHEVNPSGTFESPAKPVGGTIYYVDNFNGNDCHSGTTPDQAWKSLEKVNATRFHPGDCIYFRRGGIWFGKLHPQGDGATDAPIVISAYGTGPNPLLHGNGLQGSGVVSFYNQSYWEVGNLEIVNPADSAGDRRGVEIKAENAGVIRGIHLHHLHIHDIHGIRGHDYASKKTAGIYFGVVDDRQRPTRFDDIRVSDCLLHHISNQGIVTNNERNHKDYPGTERWHQQKFTGLVIHQNVLHHIAKNAMIVRLTEGGLVEHNLCYETALGMSGNTMFTISARGTTFQYNEGFLNRSTDADGSLYDPDLRSPGTIWQYSYSHNNSHGLVWFCTALADTGIVVRNNISSNDHGFLVYANYAFSGAKIYNNVFHIGKNRSPVIIQENAGNTHVYEYRMNRIYNYSNLTSYGFAGPENRKQHRMIRENYYYGLQPSVEEQSPRTIDDGLKKADPPSRYYDVASWFGVESPGLVGEDNSSMVNVYRNIRYAEKPETVYDSDTSSDRLLDLYLPVDKQGVKKPVILFIHGGGFSGGDKSALEGFWRNLATKGFAVISANYRLYLKHHKASGGSASENMAQGLRPDGKFHPALQKAVTIAASDAAKVLEWITENGEAFDLDAQRVAVSGGSAGAMTVLHLAYASAQTALPVGAVINMWGGLQDTSVINAGAPPMLTFHGDKDKLIHVDYAYAIDERMKAVGVLSELYILEGKGHAIYNVINRDYTDIIVKFLRNVL
ncbi:Acetyl esterase/lipase [Parapedobacter composti]|uniref:Acetyl esterase/lipase n=1 Tax=Parapedobacter composti TaxID=623281 RepID=A0A1I1E5I4_9SPHI|nr:alpha/beta hydrolase [Parapedobacter composti]SFB82337.1 Acetyl esterase/lipase [Parapedobacter composti]